MFPAAVLCNRVCSSVHALLFENHQLLYDIFTRTQAVSNSISSVGTGL